ncbi:MAG: NUDIX hydrolase [Candidatus Eremiobacteraeota bacterium]|nr:NUDIX hydrolase [Candidatus Eremiobacteraeota bacterium]
MKPRRRPTRVKHERSAGGFVLKRTGGAYHGLIIGRATPRIWSLPKGHVEPGESEQDAATREVLEETGVEGVILDKLSDIKYWFYSSRLKHSKIVHFYLMRYKKGTPVPQAGEVDEVAWVPLDEMGKRMTHLNERRLVGLVEKIVQEKSATELGF